MRIERVWAMPSRWTFQIKPIKKLVKRYVGNGRGWADPFAGNNSPAEFTNDFDPNTSAKSHMLASELIHTLPTGLSGVLYDPPYSPRQISECYKYVGQKATWKDTSGHFYAQAKNTLALKISQGGYAICFGWNTVGFGKKNGFKLVEILLVCHGVHHNDTIVTVEQKINGVIS